MDSLDMTIEEEEKICEMFENLQPEDLRPMTPLEKAKLDKAVSYVRKMRLSNEAKLANSTESLIKVPA